MESDGFSAAADLLHLSGRGQGLRCVLHESFPTSWVFPPDTTAFNVEEQGSTGTIVTAVSETPSRRSSSFLNNEEVDAGFEITEGETEEDDAEANWTTEDYRGRWTIRESAGCPGETVVQEVRRTPELIGRLAARQ